MKFLFRGETRGRVTADLQGYWHKKKCMMKEHKRLTDQDRDPSLLRLQFRKLRLSHTSKNALTRFLRCSHVDLDETGRTWRSVCKERDWRLLPLLLVRRFGQTEQQLDFQTVFRTSFFFFKQTNPPPPLYEPITEEVGRHKLQFWRKYSPIYGAPPHPECLSAMIGQKRKQGWAVRQKYRIAILRHFYYTHHGI